MSATISASSTRAHEDHDQEAHSSSDDVCGCHADAPAHLPGSLGDEALPEYKPFEHGDDWSWQEDSFCEATDVEPIQDWSLDGDASLVHLDDIDTQLDVDAELEGCMPQQRKWRVPRQLAAIGRAAAVGARAMVRN